MLDKQILKDSNNTPMGVFIPMTAWNELVSLYPDIEDTDNELPQCENDFVDERLEMVKRMKRCG